MSPVLLMNAETLECYKKLHTLLLKATKLHDEKILLKALDNLQGLNEEVARFNREPSILIAMEGFERFIAKNGAPS